MAEYTVYDDADYRLVLKSNGFYTLYEKEGGKLYGAATGDHSDMLELFNDRIENDFDKQSYSRMKSAIT